MSIAFHCEHCNRKIEAPDGAGGKWGKCPSCRNKVYVPSPDTGEELKLAPVDGNDLAEQRRLMAETRRIEQEIMNEQDVPPEGSDGTLRKTDPPLFKLNDNELVKNIVLYLRLMADGDLNQAESTENTIVSCGKRAVKIIEEIALSEIPRPELADIPPQVLAGMVRTLRAKIK